MSRENEYRAPELWMIPIDRIDVQFRERNKQVFAEIVENIQNIGLKKPIVVTPRPQNLSADIYSYAARDASMPSRLGQQEIPAMVVDVDDESAYIMSLAENIARRKFNPLELMVAELITCGKKVTTKEKSHEKQD